METHTLLRSADQLDPRLRKDDDRVRSRLPASLRDGTLVIRRASAICMQPIHELLSQIRWDPNFTGEFEVAFVDRMKPDLQHVPVNAMRFDASNPSTFRAFDEEGNLVSIPLHRIRKVYRNGTLIWSRDTE